MHFFGRHTLERFIGLVSDRYEAVQSDTPTITISRLTLPYRKLIVLPAR